MAITLRFHTATQEKMTIEMMRFNSKGEVTEYIKTHLPSDAQGLDLWFDEEIIKSGHDS